MSVAHFRVYEELNEFLSFEKCRQRFAHTFKDPATAGEVLRSLGIPLEPIDLLLVNDESADFSRKIMDGDRVSVYPVFESMDIGSVTRLPSRPLRRTRFVVDAPLGRLARNLRLLGFDSLHRPDATRPQLLSLMEREKRIILTRKRRLLEEPGVTHGYCVGATNPDRQTVEIIRRFDLLNCLRPFTRCLECNVPLEAVRKNAIEETLPPRILHNFDRFERCPNCRRNYWRGSHFARMDQWVSRIRREAGEEEVSKRRDFDFMEK